MLLGAARVSRPQSQVAHRVTGGVQIDLGVHIGRILRRQLPQCIERLAQALARALKVALAFERRSEPSQA